jgi:hypothetical protein
MESYLPENNDEIELVCEFCKIYKTKTTSNLNRHEKKCSKQIDNKSITNNVKYICNGCNKEYKSKNSLYVHRHRTKCNFINGSGISKVETTKEISFCKIEKTIMTFYEKIFNKLEINVDLSNDLIEKIISNNNELLKKVYEKRIEIDTNFSTKDLEICCLDELFSTISTEFPKNDISKSCSIINNNYITNVYNIQFNEFGNEDLTHLTDEYMFSLAYQPFNSIQELIKHIHFNKNKLENYNCKITDLSRKKAFTRNKLGWSPVENLDDFVSSLVVKYSNKIIKIYNNKSVREKISIYQRINNDKFIKSINEGCEILRQRLYHEISQILYNKSKDIELLLKFINDN